jgi:hypothetical protein
VNVSKTSKFVVTDVYYYKTLSYGWLRLRQANGNTTIQFLPSVLIDNFQSSGTIFRGLPCFSLLKYSCALLCPTEEALLCCSLSLALPSSILNIYQQDAV